ncbi:unnamed protein product, partial [Mesorhabditis spiculigera]
MKCLLVEIILSLGVFAGVYSEIYRRHCLISQPEECSKVDPNIVPPNNRFFFTEIIDGLAHFHMYMHPDLLKVYNWYEKTEGHSGPPCRQFSYQQRPDDHTFQQVARHCSISEPTRCVKEQYDDTAIHPNERFFFTDTDFHTLRIYLCQPSEVFCLTFADVAKQPGPGCYLGNQINRTESKCECRVFTDSMHPDLMKVFNYYLTRDSIQWACQRNRTYLRMVGDRFVPYAETDKMSALIDMEYKKNSTSTTATF